MPDTAPLTSAPLISSPLDRPPNQFLDQPFYDEAVALLRGVRDHDFDGLAALCDDDFGIIDIDPSGQARVIRTRDDWEAWFRELFATLDVLDAETDSEILDFRSVATPDLGFSVLDFRQSLTIAGHTASFDCVATIVWKRTPSGWKEARWHGSVITSQIPEELTSLAAS